MSHFTSFEDDKISKSEEIIIYQFKDRAYLRQALRLAGDMYGDGNKHLALLGDTIIKVVLVKKGYYLHADREKINAVLSSKASNAFLAGRGFSTGLQKYVFKNPSQGNEVFPKPMASTVEAIVGAVFIDSGENFTVVEGVMQALGIIWPE